LVITNIVYLIIAYIMASSVSTEAYNSKIFFMISITLFFIQLIFMSLGILIATVVPKIKSVISISLSTVFGFFIISMIGSIIGDKAVRYITPFKFFDSVYIMNNASYESIFVIIGIVFVIAAIAASYLVYIKKDIHAV
jgi:ABC-2 type transport system permease protein